jgi:RNA polymerase sigma-70 factor (ECF subfamily)
VARGRSSALAESLAIRYAIDGDPRRISTSCNGGSTSMNQDVNREAPATASFPTTHWSLVIQAGSPASPQARAAVEALCSAYWYPLYAFIRRKGNDPDRALDLTQDFFARLFEKDILAAVEHRKGRFRSFLRVACRNFLIDAWRHKADVATTPISIDARDAEVRYLVEPADNLTAERLFDRAWALTLLDRVMAILAAEFADSGRSELFEQLKIVLTEGKGAVRSAVLAERLGMSEDAINTASHRLRKRYRAILQEQIVATLDDPAELDDEIRSLFDAIRPESAHR